MQSVHYYITHFVPTIGSILKRMPFLFHNDEKYLKLLFRLKLGQTLNLEHPRRFNEKMQWLKLYNHQPEYTDMVDKYKAKQIVEKLIGTQYVIPTIGVWSSSQNISWESLPQQFVLKTTHGGGGVGVVICKDKATFSVKNAILQLNRSMRISGSNGLKEWPYQNVQRRIIAEQYMEDADNHQLVDYKFHCFNGVPKVVLVCRDRYGESGAFKDFYDMEWNHLPISRELNGNAKESFEKPEEFSQMIQIAEKLSKGIPFVRIDLYLANHKIYFGEYTFFPASGLSPFYPDEWDFIMGDWLDLPNVKVL